MKLSVIIVSYNTRALTLACIASVYRETGSDCEIIVVDNASTDGSARAIHRVFPPDRYPDLRLYELEQNIGFAAANNLAATEARGEYVLLLNPDTVVLDRALDRLVRFADGHPEYGIYGGSTVFADGSRNPTAGWMKPTLWSMFCGAIGLSRLFRRSRLFNPEVVLCDKGDPPRRVDVVGGCLLLMKREHWQQLRGLDEEFFMYGEDDDLCFRALKQNLNALLVPQAQIVHHGGASETVRSDKLTKLFRAKAQLFHKHYSPIDARVRVSLLQLWVVMRIVYMTPGSIISSAAKSTRSEWLETWRARGFWTEPVRSFVKQPEAGLTCGTKATEQ